MSARFLGIESPAWMQDALCAQTDPELFHPIPGKNRALPGKSVCVVCPERAQCLEWALEHNEQHGIWGGLSPRERRLLLAERGAA